jgi:hypothetical protein
VSGPIQIPTDDRAFVIAGACGGERIEYHHRGKEEGRPWLVGPAALSARTLEERLVLSPGADE